MPSVKYSDTQSKAYVDLGMIMTLSSQSRS